MKNLWLVSALILAATTAFAADPDVVVKEAAGEAAIVDGNRARAEKDAKDKALREAVEQVAGVMVSADTLTQNSQLISDRIYANSAGYVRKYDVVSKKEERGVMIVTIRAEVGKQQLDKDLQAVKALINRMGNRKLVIILQEQTYDPRGAVTSSGVLSTVLTEAFKKDGWTIIDPAFAAGKLKLSSGVSLGTPEAKEIGELTKAEYILYGTVSFRNQAADPNWGGFDNKGKQLQFPVTGEWELTLFATDSGSQIAKVAGKFNSQPADLGPKGTYTISYERTAHDIAVHRGQEVVGAVRKAALEQLRDAEQNGNRLVVHVVGLSDYSAVQGFKKVLAESITGVRAVKPGTFGGGKAQFDVTFVGTTDELADRVGGKAFKGKKINVTGVTGNTLEVTLAK
ncbi:MAG: flagellar assembly protein T N-terminal domain-containing protein [Myxococcaceae bacterium]